MRNLSDKYESAVVDETEEVYDYESVMAESYIGAQAGIAAYLAQFSDSPIGQLVMSNWTDALTEIVQDTYDGITSQLQKDTSNVLTKLFSTGRGVAPDKLDLIDKRTVSFLHDYNYTSITHMNDDIQNGIKGMVYRGLSAEETPEQIIKKVSTHIKQPMPVYRTADLVKVERGAKNIRDINPLRFLSPKARGMMISRTNPAMSYNRGLLEGYKFDGVRKVYSPHRAGECVSCSTIVSSGPWQVGSVTPPPWHTNCGHNLYPVLDSTKITGDLRSLLNYEDVIPINPPNFNMDFLGAKSPAKELVIETAAKELPDHLRMDHLFSEGVIEWIPDSTKAVYKSPTHFQFGSKLTKEDLRSKFLEFCGYRHWTRYERELTSKGFKRSDFGKAFSEHLTVKGGVKNVDLKPVIEKDVFKVEMKKTPVTASTKEVVKDVGGLGGYLSDTTKIKIIPADLIAQMSPAMQKLTGDMLTEVGENLSKLPSSISEKIVFRYDNKVRGVLSPTGKEIVASTDQGIYRTIANDILWPALKDSTDLNRRDFIAIATDWIDGVFPKGSAQDKLMKSLMDTYSKTVKASPKKLQPDYGSNITKANLRHFYTPSQMYKDNIAMTTKRYDPKIEMRDGVWAFAKDENDLRRRLDYVDDHEVGFIVADDGRLKLITKGEDHRVGIERTTQRLLTADGSMYGHYHPASIGPSQADLMNQIHNYIQGVNRSPNIVVTRNHIYKNEIKDYNKVKQAFNSIESVEKQLTAARTAYIKEEQRIRSTLPWGKEIDKFLAKTDDPEMLQKYYKYVDRLREDNSYLLAQRYGDALGIEITRYKNDTAHTLKEIFEGEIGTANKVITLDDVTNALNLPKSTTKQVEFTPPVVKKAPKPVTKVLPEPKQSNLGPLFEEEHGLQLVDFDKRSAPSLKKGLSYLPDDIKNTLIVARKDMKGAVYDATTETVSGRYMADIVQTIARDVLYPKYGDVSGLNIDEFVKLAGQYFKTTNRDPNSIKLFDDLFKKGGTTTVRTKETIKVVAKNKRPTIDIDKAIDFADETNNIEDILLTPLTEQYKKTFVEGEIEYMDSLKLRLSTINADLYKGRKVSESNMEKVALADDIISRTSLPTDTILWRGIKASYVEKLKTGDISDWKGYAFSSTDEFYIKNFMKEGDYKIKIIAPKGSKALYVDAAYDATGSEPAFIYESEFIHPRGQAFKVLENDVKEKRITIRLLDTEKTVIPELPPTGKQLDKTQKKVLPVMISKDTPNFNKENGYITLRTREEADAYYETVSKKMKPIHGDEGEALQLYKGPFSYPINEYLRTGVAHDESGALIKGKGEAFLTDLITNLSKGINKNVVPEDIKVTRFMGEVDDLKGLKQGDTYVEKGFLSTSIRPYLIKDTVEQGWKASILVPQGTNGLFVEGIRGAKKLGNESELLMDKGHTLKILSINQKLKTVNFKLVEIKDNHLPGDIVIPKEVKTDYRDILRQIPSDVNLRFVYDPNLFTSKHSFIEDGVYHVQVITKHDLNRIEEVVQEKHPGFKFSLNEKPKLPKLPDTTKRLKVPKGYTNLKNAEEAGDWEEAWRDSLDEFLSETYIKQGVTNRELEEVNNYRFLTGYKEINGALLDKTKMTTDIEERIGTLDSVIAKVTLPENMILHTGVRDSKIDELNVGDIWSKQTFLSTSADEQVARRYRDQDLKKGKDAWFVDIIAPKSTHGIYTDAAADHVSMSTFGESEFLLQRNQEFKVISKDEVNKTMVVKVHEKEPPKVVGIDEKQIEKEFAKDRKRFYDDLKAEEKEREAYRAAEKKGLPAPPPPVFATGIKLTKADEKWAHTFSIDSSFWKSPSLKHEIGAFLDDYGNIKAFAKGDAHHVGLPKGSFIGGDNLGYVYMHYHPRDVAPSPDDFANYVDLHASGVRLPTLIMTDTKMYTLSFKKDGSPLNAMFIQKEIADIQKEWQDTLRSAKARAINDEHFKRLQSEASEKLAEKLAKLHNIELKITDRDDWWAENEMGKLIPKGYAKKETKEKIEDKVKLPKYYDEENSAPLKAEDLPIVNSKTAAEWSQHSKKINHETAIGLDKDGKIIYYVNGDKSVVSTDPNMFLEASPIKAHIHSHPSSHGPSAPDVWEGMRHDITMDNDANFVSKGIHTMVVTDGYIYDLHVTDPVKFRNRQADAGNLLESLSTGIGMRARDYIREDLSSDIFLENARRTVMRNSKYSEFTESIGRSTFWKADDMEKKYPTIYGEFKRDVRAEIDKEARGIYGGLYHEVLNNRGKNWGFKCDVYPRDTDPVDILRGNAKRLIPKKVWSKTGEEVERFE